MSDFVKCASTTDFADNENKAIEVEGVYLDLQNKEGFLRLRICARTSCNRLRAGAFGVFLSFALCMASVLILKMARQLAV